MNDQSPPDWHSQAPSNDTPAKIEANSPVGSPGRVGQATAVEQSRAVAEVQSAVVMARANPRDSKRALAQMRESCGMMRLAERAFFRFPRGGQTVSGASVHLARELARCWGNIDYGVKELARDDNYGQSEMLAFAWDLETNARSELAFIVPHMRDKKGGAQKLVDMRDIYENNANNGARRLRECIFSMLPPWFTEEAKEICNRTITETDQSLPDQIAEGIKRYQDIGVTLENLEAKLGRARGAWTAHDVAQLRVIYQSLQRGEISKEEEFPSIGAPASVGDINAQASGRAQAPEQPQSPPPPPEPQPAPPPPPEPSHAADAEASKSEADDGDGYDHRATFETVKKAVSEAETGVDLVNAWAAHTDALNALKEAHPDKHDELDSFYVGREAKLQREGEQQSTEAAE